MLVFIKDMAEKAGEIALKYFRGLTPNEIHTKKNARDVVSIADREVERFIRERVREKYPDHSFFGEETGKTMTQSEYCWIVDPIDGTQSFIRKHPYFSISIALAKQGEVIAGVVYAPALGMLFSAEKDKGAWENGAAISNSRCEVLSQAACTTGFACIRDGLTQNNLPYFSNLVPKIQDIKRCGSAALDCCFTASGRYDAYWEFALQPYDTAAGTLIAHEAGCKITDLLGGEDFPRCGVLVAATEKLHRQFLPFFTGVKF